MGFRRLIFPQSQQSMCSRLARVVTGLSGPVARPMLTAGPFPSADNLDGNYRVPLVRSFTREICRFMTSLAES